MTTLHVFRSQAAVMGYSLKDGSVIHFVNGMYATADKKHIEELTELCTSGHYNYFLDEKEITVDSEILDPMAMLRARIREEERIKLIAATDVNRDMGQTDQSGKLGGIANSQSVMGAVASSNGASTGAGNVTVTPVSVSVKSK